MTIMISNSGKFPCFMQQEVLSLECSLVMNNWLLRLYVH
jgi:hypothetical protein